MSSAKRNSSRTFRLWRKGWVGECVPLLASWRCSTEDKTTSPLPRRAHAVPDGRWCDRRSHEPVGKHSDSDNLKLAADGVAEHAWAAVTLERQRRGDGGGDVKSRAGAAHAHAHRNNFACAGTTAPYRNKCCRRFPHTRTLASPRFNSCLSSRWGLRCSALYYPSAGAMCKTRLIACNTSECIDVFAKPCARWQRAGWILALVDGC